MADLRSHWRELNDRNDLSGVGQSGLPAAMNRWLYRAQRRQVARLLDELDIRPATVYDVGAGTGYWSAFWQTRGATVRGCDFAPEAVARLGEAFELRDIAVEPPTGTYELVWVANVLLHILDEDRFSSALANIAGAVQPGGLLVMLEQLQIAPFRPRAGDKFSMARSKKAYLDPLAASGLTLVELRRATAVTSDPIEASTPFRFRLWLAFWRAIKGPARIWPATGGLMGRVAYVLDPVVLRLVGGVATKIVVLRRSEADGARSSGS